MTKTVCKAQRPLRSKKSKPKQRNVAARQTAPKTNNHKSRTQPPIVALKLVEKRRADSEQAGAIAILQSH